MEKYKARLIINKSFTLLLLCITLSLQLFAANTSFAAEATKDHTINIEDFSFNPAELTINVGDKVTWTNQDTTSHTIASKVSEINSPELAPGATFSYTFSKPGKYSYYCSIHPTMKGEIIVK